MGSIRNPKQYCFAIIAAMGSIQNPKQYCFAISSITTHKVLTSWMHEASHWKCQCRILTARTSGHGKKMCRPWSQLAGNMPGHLALIRGNESHIGDYNLIFLCFFFVVWIVVTVSVTRQSPIYIYICNPRDINDELSLCNRWSITPLVFWLGDPPGERESYNERVFEFDHLANGKSTGKGDSKNERFFWVTSGSIAGLW